MKRSLLLMGILYAFSNVMAQQGQPMANAVSSRMVEALDKDWKMTVASSGGSFEAGNTFSGSVFYNDEWENGYVKLTDNRMAKDLTLKFNAYTNDIYLKRDSQVMVLDKAAVPVAEFGLNDPTGLKIFRRGFPAAGSNTASTFYEVLASGKLTLLRLYAKRIVEKRDLNHVPVQEMTNAEFWYVFDAATQTTTEIKHHKNALIEAFPGQADAIRAVIQDKKLRMKGDEDWVTLFNELNSRP